MLIQKAVTIDNPKRPIPYFKSLLPSVMYRIIAFVRIGLTSKRIE